MPGDAPATVNLDHRQPIVRHVFRLCALSGGVRAGVLEHEQSVTDGVIGALSGEFGLEVPRFLIINKPQFPHVKWGI